MYAVLIVITTLLAVLKIIGTLVIPWWLVFLPIAVPFIIVTIFFGIPLVLAGLVFLGAWVWDKVTICVRKRRRRS